MKDVLREDVRHHLPTLCAIDNEQQVLYARFIDVDWEYIKPLEVRGMAGGGKWWKKVVRIIGGDSAALSEHWRNELSLIIQWASDGLGRCRRINDASLEMMETPEAYLDALPKHAKALPLGESLRKAVERQAKNEDGVASTLDTADNVFDLLAKDGIEAANKLSMVEVRAPFSASPLIAVDGVQLPLIAPPRARPRNCLTLARLHLASTTGPLYA